MCAASEALCPRLGPCMCHEPLQIMDREGARQDRDLDKHPHGQMLSTA